MTETIHLMPPEAGPTADPVLFAVAAGLAERFPLAAPARATAGALEPVAASLADDPPAEAPHV